MRKPPSRKKPVSTHYLLTSVRCEVHRVTHLEGLPRLEDHESLLLLLATFQRVDCLLVHLACVLHIAALARRLLKLRKTDPHLQYGQIKYLMFSFLCDAGSPFYIILTFNMHFDKENNCVQNLINAMPHHQHRFPNMKWLACFMDLPILPLHSKSPQHNQSSIQSWSQKLHVSYS